MSQLLILGNGFDVHCGLQSKYRDFFRSSILDTIGERSGLRQLQAGVSGFWENLLLEYYKVDEKNDYNWCDIERIIKDTLLDIYFGKNPSRSINQGIYHKATKFLSGFTIGVRPDELDRIEKFLFDYCVKFISLNSGSAEILKLLVEHLLQQLYNLEKRFCKYLKNQIVNPNNKADWNEEYIIKAVNLLAGLTGFACYDFDKLDDIITVQNKKYLVDVFDNLNDVFILNFNYTALFDILEVESPCYYNNVHGKLCNNACVNGCDTSNIILGIDDNLIQAHGSSSELRSFSKTYRKMLGTDKYLTVLPPNENNPVAIKFYGHSLGEADYSYFQSIFDYYDLYKNNKVSLTFYYSKGFENYDAVYRLINVYGKSLANKEQGKNLIHKLLLENRLHIQEVWESQ